MINEPDYSDYQKRIHVFDEFTLEKILRRIPFVTVLYTVTDPVVQNLTVHGAQILYRGHEMGMQLTHGQPVSAAELEYQFKRRYEYEIRKRPFEKFIVEELDFKE